MMEAALVLALIVGILHWAMGPSFRSTQARAWVTGTIQRWRQPAEERPNFITNSIANGKPTIEVVIVGTEALAADEYAPLSTQVATPG
ncbi:MAG: hypothetical protein WCC01_09920 [Acidimicrobiia bacterium]